jgi:hypothetical protein
MKKLGKVLEIRLSYYLWSVFNVDISFIGESLVVLSGSDNLVFRVRNEFIPVRKPACYSGNREQHREHIRWESHGFVDNSRIEINVRVELTGDEVFVF